MFSISPSVGGKLSFNLNVEKLNISSSGTWTITPQGNFSASIKMWGAGGSSVNGGAGGFSSGSMGFVANQAYVIVVGEGGANHNRRTIGGGGFSVAYSDYQGGGLTGLFQSTYTQSNALIIAGGGGGQYGAGAGGGSSGQNGSVPGSYSSTAGTQTAGGADGGAALLGANGYYGSGGGGGYFGGGTNENAPSSGGSGYIKSGTIISGSTSTGNRTTAANSTDSERGTAGNSGTNGRIIIS